MYKVKKEQLYIYEEGDSMEKEFNLKDALMSGMDPEDLKKDFMKQLAAAQEEVKKDVEAQREDQNLTECRDNLIESILDYFDALGFKTDNTDYEDLEEIFIEIEGQIKPLLSLIASFTKDKSSFTKDKSKSNKSEILSDKAIREFLKSLELI